MLFSSYEFIFAFLPVTLLVYFWLNGRRLVVAGKFWLVLSSLFFYGWWNPVYVPLILLSMGVNFVLGRELGLRRMRDGAASSPGLLSLGVGLNLALLAYFKYADFFVANANALFGGDFPLPGVVLPLAISFFTFQQIAYLVDCHREGGREYDPLGYALFVCFFPQLIAGPIVHHREMMPQFASPMSLAPRYRNIALGLFIFSAGLFKKVVVADSFSPWVGAGFESTAPLNFFEAWVTSLAYTFQIYFDFSGYTDMAIGCALLFNIHLPINFNSPYKATDIRDFWRRWHMTLSRFLRDYVYVPLGGNRDGRWRTLTNLFATFLLGGLWHGASWMFVIWGALHGLAMAVHRLWSEAGGRMPAWLAWLLTFNFVNVTWVFFRAHDLDAALNVLRGMAGLQGVVLPGSLAGLLSFLGGEGIGFGVWMDPGRWGVWALVAVLAALVAVITLPNSVTVYARQRAGHLARPRWAVVHGVVFAVAIGVAALSADIEFLYFNF